MQLAGAGDNVLASLLTHALHHGVGARQALQALHQLGQVRGHLRGSQKGNMGGSAGSGMALAVFMRCLLN